MVLAATAIGVQPFQARFKRRRFEDAPPLSQWRCNLTGLSQIHNLYFIAYGSDIYVYVPQFPTQKISEEPLLIFTSQPSAPRLPGHLDQRNPHAINNLVVKFLGSEEIVAAVRDDGDVDAFLVRHIVHAVSIRAEAANELGAQGNEIRPFFQSNVGKSAWGLDVHAQARILATSANTHEIRVFKFGLLQREEDESSEDEGLDSDSDNGRTEKAQQRETDVTLDILNGEANIPYIAFCHTGDDPEGRWLLTTDISGVCRVMDLAVSKPVMTFRFGPSFQLPNSGGYDSANAGWVMLFLDRRAFQEEDSVDAAVGLDQGETLPDLKRNPTIWDISKTVQHLPESSEPFVYNRAKKRKKDERSSAARQAGVADPVDTSAGDIREDNHDDDAESDDSSDGGARLDLDSEVLEQASASEDTHEDSSNPDNDPPDISTILSTNDAEPGSNLTIPPQENPTIQNETSSDSSTDPISDNDSDTAALIDDGEDPDDPMDEDSVPFPIRDTSDSIRENRPSILPPTDETFYDKLPSPILHASVRNIYLLQPFTQQQQGTTHSNANAQAWNAPMIGLAHPLRQAIQQEFSYLRLFERLNMTVSIPSLGIVILASQKGRALVLCLTKIHPGATYPHELSSARPDWTKKTVYAMRAECILPFVGQERENQRPFAPLHGIAAAPLQGCGEVDGGRGGRWRVMMMYQDHSILSYEIGRRTGGGDVDGGTGSVEVEDLVV